ncbi:MAG: RdgB/HAM1 family non-canonical purine NTP pyrophosphatase [Ruminococcaceae bacterium]|nr:RdgB/HAM1 family non-canonical purine NTP pyrophosphatase [Oscillospiraceae bacterium]
MKFFIATKNAHKVIEFKRILEPMGIEVLCERDLPFSLPDVEEDGTTFEENATIKAAFACEKTGMVSLADDSGLCVDALDGAPGIFSARYSGVHGDDKENNRKLLRELEGVPYEKRTARFVSAVACVFPDGRKFTVTGKCEGHIDFEEKGENGFGYDPLFVGEIGCFGLASGEEKDKVSHRGKALVMLRDELKNYI